MQSTATVMDDVINLRRIFVGVVTVSRNVVLQAVIICTIMVVTQSELQAATWRLERGVALDLNTAENLGENRQGDSRASLVQLSPFIGVLGVGKKSELQLRGSLNLRRRLDTDASETDTTLKFRSNTRLIERVLSVSTAASLSDRFIDDDAIVDDSVLGFGTKSTIREFSVTPTLTIPLGSDAEIETILRLATAKGTLNDDPIGSDTTELRSKFAKSTEQGFIATAQIGYLNTNFDNGEMSETSTVSGGGSFPVSRTLSINGSGGYEELRLDAVDAEEDGRVWRLGLNWNPLERISVEFNYGRRFFGITPELLIQLQGRRSLFQVALTRNLAFERRALDTIQPIDQGNTDPTEGQDPGAAIVDPIGDSGTLSPISRSAKAIDERASISYKIFGKRTELTGILSWYERSQLDETETVESKSAEIIILRRLSNKTSVAVTLSERRSESETAGLFQSGGLRRAGIQLVHLL